MQDSSISIAYSPCPNDTFIFCKLAQQTGVKTYLHDVETLNNFAFADKYDVTKLSFHAWILLKDRYELLNVGAALGRGCGPLVISKDEKPLAADAVIAVPGEYTTAHLLLRLWNPQLQNRVFMPFDQIMNAVENGEADAGVIIHEGRFVYQDRGFKCLQDLGQWWEQSTGMPIPLGCIAARRSLGRERIEAIGRAIRASVDYGFAHPDLCLPYITSKSQELEPEVVRSHIELYVNDFSKDLGREGIAAIETFMDRGRKAGVLPESGLGLMIE